MAWLIHSVQEPSSIWKFLSRWIPALRPTPHPIVELRTSCLDGSDVHEIGHLDAPKTREDPRPEHLQWLPDGKQLSFIYKDRLYTVPAD